MSEMIQVRGLTKQYGNKGAVCKALQEVELDISEGEFVAIMGPSGSGKTTLLNIMSTIDKPTMGQVLIAGNALEKLKENEVAKFRRDTIGFVFQDFNLLDNMTIRDNIALPLTLNNIKAEIILKKMDELTYLFGIETQLDKYPYQLSGGQKQRAAVCRALITKPKILFADEPTGALDSKAAAQLLECFKNVKKEYGITVVMVTHDVSAASYCDRVVFLKDGRINGKLETNGDSRNLFKKILNMVAVLGGDNHERL
jgi:putative ABC transport system ATP-binding protein